MYKKEMMESEMVKLLSEALREMKDPGIAGIVTVTRVELSKDKRYARVYFSIFEDDESKREEVFKILEKAKGYFRSHIARNLHTFKAPELNLINDKGIEKAFELDKIFKRLEEKDERDTEN